MENGFHLLKVPRFWSQVMILLSGAAVVLAGIGAFWVDVYLASTQWLLVAILLVVSAIYVRLES